VSRSFAASQSRCQPAAPFRGSYNVSFGRVKVPFDSLCVSVPLRQSSGAFFPITPRQQISIAEQSTR
jgi:hypothetical protein